MAWPKGNGAGWGGEANGPGWGNLVKGDGAKGAGTGGPKLGTGGKSHDKHKRPIPTEGAARIGNKGAGAGRGHMNDRTKLKRVRSELMEDRLFGIGMGTITGTEPVATQAIYKLHAIYNGTPVATTINANVDDVSKLSDDELRAELARAGRACSADRAGDGDTEE